MLKESDFIWKEHHANNMEENPLDNWYCIIDVGDHARKYSIVPQYHSDDGIVISKENEPEYYILFETVGRKATGEDKRKTFYKNSNYDDYLFEENTFIRVFANLEEAKKRAYYNYFMIYGYVLSHLTNDVEKDTKNHFSVK